MGLLTFTNNVIFAATVLFMRMYDLRVAHVGFTSPNDLLTSHLDVPLEELCEGAVALAVASCFPLASVLILEPSFGELGVGRAGFFPCWQLLFQFLLP